MSYLKPNLLFVRLNDAFFERIFDGLITSQTYGKTYLIARKDVVKNLTDGGSYELIDQVLFEDQFSVDKFPAGFVLDANILQKFRDVESTFLSMSDRLSFTPISVKERKIIYYTLLEYWLNFFDTHKIDQIFFPSLPHMGWDYLLMEVARFRRIPVVYIERTLINYFVFLMRDGQMIKNLEPVNENILLDKFREESIVINISKTRHPNTFLKDILRIFYGNIKMLFRNASPISRISAYYYNETPGKFQAFKNHVNFAFYIHRLEKIYKSICSPVNLQSDYVYFPLHLQPERTTCPMGGDFDFQLLALKILSEALPENFTIYTKEHPRQFDKRKHILKSQHARDVSFYNRLISIPKVKVVDYNEDHNQLIAHCRFTATITGSVGWEGMLQGKGNISFGKLFWYADCDSCYHVGDLSSCKTAVNAVLQKMPDDILHDVRVFLKRNQPYFIASLNSFEAIKKSKMDIAAAVNNIVKNITGDASR